MSISIQDAVVVAVDGVKELFASQAINNVMLEEVDRDDHENYLITVGFDRSGPAANVAVGIAGLLARARVYKVVKIDQHDGSIQSVKDRMLK